MLVTAPRCRKNTPKIMIFDIVSTPNFNMFVRAPTIWKHSQSTPKHIPTHPPKKWKIDPDMTGNRTRYPGFGVRTPTHWAIHGPVNCLQSNPINPIQSVQFNQSNPINSIQSIQSNQASWNSSREPREQREQRKWCQNPRHGPPIHTRLGPRWREFTSKLPQIIISLNVRFPMFVFRVSSVHIL